MIYCAFFKTIKVISYNKLYIKNRPAKVHILSFTGLFLYLNSGVLIILRIVLLLFAKSLQE